MKLWKRTVLLMLTTLFAALTLVGGFTLYYTASEIVDTTASASERKLELSANMWRQVWNSALYKQMTETGKNAYSDFLFQNYLGPGYALLYKKEVLINRTAYEIKDLEPVFQEQTEGKATYHIQHLDDKYLLIQTHELDEPQGYIIFSATDITEKTDQIRRLAEQYLLVYLLIFLLAGIFIYSMMKKNMETMEALQETAQKQELLLGALAHEMKTPLTSIIGYSDSLLHVNLSEDMQQRSLEHINREGHRMEALTGKILQLVGLYQNDALQVQEYPISELLDRVQTLEKLRVAEAGMQLVMEQEAFVLSMDIDLMESLLVNFIENAIRASKPGNKITVDARKEAGSRRITVTDQGCGIPEEELHRITEAFYMVDKSRSRKAGGAGLGLALCKKIAELHDAQLEIQSTLGQGTAISIVFSGEK